MNYQWYKNDILIPAATSATYITPAVAFSDTGSVFTVTVSNSLGAVTTLPATLTVTARGPAVGDLRFQMVDAPSTFGEYDYPAGLSSLILPRTSFYFNNSIGTPLYFGPIVCGQAISLGMGCAWPFIQFNPYNSGNGQTVAVGYASGYSADFLLDLQSSTFGAGGVAINSSNSVISSLDIEPGDGLFGVSYFQSSSSSGFQLNQLSVVPAMLQTVISNEAAQGRVVTGISYNGGQIMLVSYAWQADIATAYESQVMTATSATVPSVVAGLAQAGYIITALGGSNLNDSYLLVGTRVKGDTMPRPFLASTSSVYDLAQVGYAVVGVIENGQGVTTFLGER